MNDWTLVHLITHLEIGGAQDAALAQVVGSRLPWRRRLLVYGAQGAWCERARSLDGVEAIELSRLRRVVAPAADVATIGDLVSLFRSLSGPVLLHSHSPKTGVLGRIAAPIAGVAKLVHSIHGFGYAPSQRLFAGVERSLSRFADAYTADSEANARRARGAKLLGGRPISVVHCGIDVDAFRRDDEARARLRGEWKLEANDVAVLTLANFKAQKDPSTFVRVAAQLRGRARFFYAGGGDNRAAVEELSRRLQAPITFLGWRDDPAALLSAADLFLLTSRWEGLPQSVTQAMAAGLPVVATAVDGTPEAVLDGQTGFLAQPGDVRGLSHAVRRLTDNRELRESLGARAAEQARRFSRAAMLSATDQVYREVGAGSSSRVRSKSSRADGAGQAK